jgi:hypothetical protein
MQIDIMTRERLQDIRGQRHFDVVVLLTSNKKLESGGVCVK